MSRVHGTRRARIRGRLLVAVAASLAALALAAHLVVAYRPRARPDRLDPSDPSARLLDGSRDVAIWIPYPHQNLQALASDVGDLDDYLGSIARLTGLAAPLVPRFGPWPAPPARSLAVASDRSGRGVEAVARVFPSVALLARLAGHLAGNPWLAGGELVSGGRRLAIAWRGTLWTVHDTAMPPATGRGGGTPTSRAQRALAWIRLERAVAPFPPGLYRLFARPDGGFEIVSGATAPALPPVPRGEAPALLLATAPGGLLGASAGALLIFPAPPGGASLELPEMAVLQRGEERWSLPGEHLLGLLGRRLRTSRAAGWTVISFDEPGLRRAATLAPALAAWTAAPGGAARPVFAADLEIGPAHRLVATVARTLASVPLVGDRLARPWQDAARVLAPWQSLDHLAISVGRGPDGVRIAVEGVPSTGWRD